MTTQTESLFLAEVVLKPGPGPRPSPSPTQALFEGPACSLYRPEPFKARPKPGLSGQAGPGTTLVWNIRPCVCSSLVAVRLSLTSDRISIPVRCSSMVLLMDKSGLLAVVFRPPLMVDVLVFGDGAMFSLCFWSLWGGILCMYEAERGLYK